MSYASDILLGAGTLGVIAWCIILARRITNINSLDTGVGGAIAVLSAQVDDMTRALAAAQSAALSSGASIVEVTARAETISKRLELLVAALHDLPDAEPKSAPLEKPDALTLSFAARTDEVRLPEFLSARKGRAI